MDKQIFISLAKVFNEHGYRLYMIGGTTRDYLLDHEVYDYDFVTDATPDNIKEFVPDADFTFAKFGSVRIKVKDVKVDVTTLRVEGKYLDSRHPSEIKYVKRLEEDYVRRDFTVNAIYIDENFKVIDFCGGLKDLENKIIRFIGDPDTRIKEDPLRIIRAERFIKKLGFCYDPDTLISINKNRHLLEKLNQEKVRQELRKLEDN